MAFPDGVQLATLTFSNPITHLGTAATRTEVTIEPTASVVWASTGQPVDDFPETVTPGNGMPGSVVAPFVDQAGFKDAAGNTFTMWAYRITRRAFFGNLVKTVSKVWQPLVGQNTIDFDLIPEGSVGLAVSAPVVQVSSFGGRTGAVVLTEADLPTRLGDAALDAKYVDMSKVHVGLDTDGIPYYSDAIPYAEAVPVLTDTDGVPYLTL